MPVGVLDVTGRCTRFSKTMVSANGQDIPSWRFIEPLKTPCIPMTCPSFQVINSDVRYGKTTESTKKTVAATEDQDDCIMLL